MTRSLSLLGAAQKPSLRAQRAHAMKNCLAIMSAVLELVDDELSAAAQGRVSRARAATDRLRLLLDDDLQFPGRASRCTAHHLDVAALLRAVVDRLQDRADARGVTLTCASAGGQIIGDREELAEALTDLTSNSIDATPAGGTVSVSSRITEDGDQEWTVEDTGEGMSPEALARLGQLHCTTRATGSGLGVALAREAVARHGGLVLVASAPAEGTTVTLWLPVDPRV